MIAADRRTHCLECDPERGKSKSRAIYPDGSQYCFRCAHRAKPCLSCGELFTHRHPEHDRCDGCFSSARPVRTAPPRPVEPSVQAPPDPQRLAAIWAHTVAVRGSIGETYLRYRNCALPLADGDLRYLPGTDRRRPRLCARVTDAMTARPLTLHFTKLADDGCGKAGTDCDKLLLPGHPKKGGVVRLWPDEAVTHGLGIAEGIETALAAAHAFTPVWAMVDAGNMAKFPVLAGVESLVIFADNDPAGLSAARACGSRWAAAGREVRLVVPDRGDVNDAVAA